MLGINKQSTLLLSSLIVLISVFISPQAHALLLGNNMQVDREYGTDFNSLSNLLSATTGLIGSGAELGPAFYSHLTIDFSDTELLITSDYVAETGFGYGGAASCCTFNGYRFTDISGIAAFESVSIISNDIVGFDTSNIIFGEDYFFLNFSGLTLANGDQLRLSFNRAQVSESSSFVLLSFGMFVMGLYRRRKLVK